MAIKDDKAASSGEMLSPDDFIAWVKLRQGMEDMLKAIDALENRVEIVFVLGNDTRH